jgi:hypothetical protein
MHHITYFVLSIVLWGIVLGLPFVQAPTDQASAAERSSIDDGRGVDDGRGINAAADGHPTPAPATTRRYLVTYVKSRTDAPRSATVVTVVNRSSEDCEVKVLWHRGFEPEVPICTTTAVVGPRIGHDFCSRDLLDNLTTCNSSCEPEASFLEGEAVLFSSPGEACGQLGVDARVYYTTGEDEDTGVAAVSTPTILGSSGGNLGD